MQFECIEKHILSDYVRLFQTFSHKCSHIPAIYDDVREMELDVAIISWQLRGLHGNYGMYVVTFQCAALRP